MYVLSGGWVYLRWGMWDGGGRGGGGVVLHGGGAGGGRGLIDGELTLTWRVGVVRCSSSLGLPPAPKGYPPKLCEIPRR